jgi:imidazolonepropionase-like amidohydrolase
LSFSFKVLLFLMILVSGLFAQTYITNVTIADVENKQWITGQTVVLTGDRISNVSATGKIIIPLKAQVIDGEGKYLIPGLVDAHIHFSQSGGLYTRPDAIDLRKFRPYQEEINWVHTEMENTLRRYLQNGITTVIDVGTTINFLKRRDSFKEDAHVPNVYMSGPLLTTYEPKALANLGDDGPFNLVTSIEDARKMVQAQLVHQPDMIKIWYIVGRDTSEIEANARKYLPIIKAIIEEAHKHNIKMAVHATQRITAELAVENGCDYLVHSIDDEILSDDFVQLLKKKKTILCPTLIVHDGYVNTFGQKVKASYHELRMADPIQLGSLLDLKHLSDTALINRYRTHINSEESKTESAMSNNIMATNLKKLSDAGVIIATGTDAGNIGTLHASSYLAEIMAMQQSGMTNWQILEASTINGAKVLGKEDEFGSISEGKKANLVLLDADPAEDLQNITSIYMVINKGVVIDLDTLIQETPEVLAQKQLNGYNFRDIDAFMEPYSEEIEVYQYPDKLLYKGKAEMRKDYEWMFDNTPNLHCELLDRSVAGNIVTDSERIQIGEKVMEATAVYHIENGKIRKAYFKQ